MFIVTILLNAEYCFFGTIIQKGELWLLAPDC